jgi:hypothetical protein
VSLDAGDGEISAETLRRVVHGAEQPEPLRLLLAGLDGLGALTPADLPPEVALQVAATLLVAQDRLQALALQAVADVETRDLYQLDGSGSTGAWVDQQMTSMPRSHVALARKLDRVPQLTARVAEGGISIDGAVLVARALDRLRPYVDRPDGVIDGQPAEQVLTAVLVDGVRQLVAEGYGGLADADPRLVRVRAELADILSFPLPELARMESAFLLLARHVEPRLLRRALAVLVDAVLPNQLAERSDDARACRGLELVRDPEGSGWLLRGSLDDECGERLHTAMTAVMATDPENADDTAARRCGDEFGHRRSATQRRHDALNLLLGKVLGSGVLGSRGKVPVQIGVTVSLEALHDQPGALPARTTSGAVVPAGLVRRWLCDSAVTRFILSLGGRVLEGSHTERTARPHERRIKHVETGGICQAAGCSRGSPIGDALVPHHPVPYSVEPVTRLDEIVLLCGVSHDDVHVGGKTIRLKDGRSLNATGWVE